ARLLERRHRDRRPRRRRRRRPEPLRPGRRVPRGVPRPARTAPAPRAGPHGGLRRRGPLADRGPRRPGRGARAARRPRDRARRAPPRPVARRRGAGPMTWPQLLGLAAIAYALKAFGVLVLGGTPPKGRAADLVRLLPAALLAALVAVQTFSDG